MIRLLRRSVVATVLLCSTPSAYAQSVKTRSVRIFVDGMVCSFCAQGLIKVFEKKKGVVGVEAFLDEGAIVIRMQEEQPLSEQQIRELVKDAGYDVRKVEPTPTTT